MIRTKQWSNHNVLDEQGLPTLKEYLESLSPKDRELFELMLKMSGNKETENDATGKRPI